MPRLWIDTELSLIVTVGTPLLRTLMTGVTSTDTRLSQMTLLRTIVGFDVARTVHDSGEGSERLHAGIGIASQEGFASGNVAQPGIMTDFPARGWVWRNHWRIWGFAADQPAIFTRRVDLSLKSQRKLENGEAYIMFNLTAIEGVASTTTVTGIIRQLWLVG